MNETVNNVLESVNVKRNDLPKHMIDLLNDPRYVRRVETRLIQRKFVESVNLETGEKNYAVKVIQKDKTVLNPAKMYHGNRFEVLPYRGTSLTLGSQKCFKKRKNKSGNTKIIQVKPTPKFVLNKTAMSLIKEGAAALLKNSFGKIKREYLMILPYMKNYQRFSPSL